MMSERIDVIFDEGTGKEFHKLLEGPEVLRDDGDLCLVTRNRGTIEGAPAVMLTFSVEVDGKLKRAQTVTTVTAFLTAAEAIRGKYW